MPVDPTEVEIIRAAIDSKLLELHTSMPATVVVYNPLLQTVDVQPVIKRAISTYEGEIEHEILPIIHNVPMQWPGGGGYAMQFPILPGDSVWLIFSEAATAQWRTTGQISEPVDLRRHDLSYACAIPCKATLLETRIPLVPPTEARMDVPPGSAFAFSGSATQALALFVAKAPATATALTAIQTYIAALTSALAAAADFNAFKAAMVTPGATVAAALGTAIPLVPAITLKAE